MKEEHGLHGSTRKSYCNTNIVLVMLYFVRLKRGFRPSDMLFYVLQKITVAKDARFSKIHCHTLFQNHILSVASTSHIRVPVMLLLQGFKWSKAVVPFNGLTFVPNFVKIVRLFRKLKGHT